MVSPLRQMIYEVMTLQRTHNILANKKIHHQLKWIIWKKIHFLLFKLFSIWLKTNLNKVDRTEKRQWFCENGGALYDVAKFKTIKGIKS